jgi:hypothetical protein
MSMRIVSVIVCAAAAFALAAGAAETRDPGAKQEPAAEAAAAPAEAQPPSPSQPPARRKPALGPVVTDASGQQGRLHTVAAGDTLWDVSDAYLGTPWVWPSIWTDNPEVPNPHRIFPGDKLWISPTSMRRVSDAEAAALLAGQPPAATEDAAAGTVPGALQVSLLEKVGFVSDAALESAGAIVGSPRQDLLLGQDLPVYVSLGEGQVNVGDRFDVMRVEANVYDPENGRRIGVHVDRVGWVEVTRVSAESSEAVIRVASEEIQVGDRLLPRVEPTTQIEVRSTTPPIEGQIAFFPQARGIMANEDFVFLNRGSEHGLATGSPLEVYQPNGRVRDQETRTRHTLPDAVIGRLVVVSAEPTTSVALVLQTHRELERGDLFRAPTE